MGDIGNATANLSPPACGRRLLSHLIDQRATSGHQRPFASIPITNNVTDGYRDISYAIFANAINRLARWLLDNVGTPTRPCEPIVYIAAADLRYHVLCVAAVKAGYIVRSLPLCFLEEMYGTVLTAVTRSSSPRHETV